MAQTLRPRDIRKRQRQRGAIVISAGSSKEEIVEGLRGILCAR